MNSLPKPARGSIMRTMPQARIFLLLVTLMASLYLLSYRARIESGDALRAMDVLTSQSKFGDWLMDESAWFKPPRKIRDIHRLPLRAYDVQENLNLRLALPLLKFAEAIPRLGNIHTLWLFNIIVSSLNVGLIYLTLRAFDHDDRVAIFVALSAGLATNLWAYGQTFFREPLASFFILGAFFLVQMGRRHGFSAYALGLCAGLAALFMAYSTKFSAVMAIPAWLVFAFPAVKWLDRPALRRLSLFLLAALTLMFLALMFIDPLLAAFSDVPETVGHALRVYLLSPGGSLWGTSPILLMAAGGSVILLRKGRQRLVWSIWLMVVGYSLGHALTTGPHWFGGLSWPPRFLLPAVPVIMLAAAPVARAIIHQRRKLPTLLWLILLGYGIWIQFSSASLQWNHYGETLPPEARQLSEWTPGLIQPQYFRWVILPRRWADLGLDFVWTRADSPAWGLSFAAFALGLAVLLIVSVRRPKARWRYVSPLAVLLWIPLLFFNLTAVYDKDPVTQSQKESLREVLDFLTAHAQADDILLLPSHQYENFILNHLDGDRPRPIILPTAPAEAASDRQPAQIESSNPNDWLHPSSGRIIHHIAGSRGRLWLLAHTSPFMDWSFRPLERYLALHYYPLREVPLRQADDTARLLEYSTVSAAPHPFLTFAADIPTDLKYGENIRLLGFHLPQGRHYAPGDALELSLLWQSDRELAVDYTVAWFVADTARPVVQGQDSAPQAGFAPTSTWPANWPVWDHRALRLPAETARGEYQIWLLLYRHHPVSGVIERLQVSGAAVIENGTAGVLPVKLVID